MTDVRTRFIPLGKADLVARLAAHDALTAETRPQFLAVCELVSAIFHFRFHKKVEALKAAYRPFDPDLADQQKPQPGTDADAQKLQTGLRELLNDANFEPLTDDELAFALREESLFNVSLFVDFDDFAEHLVFTRGRVTHQATVGKWPFKKQIDVPTFERVALFVRWKGQSYFDAQKRGKLPFVPGSTLLKLFKDVPRADLEMLFPNTQVRMKTRDKLILGVPGVAGGIAFLFKAGASLLAALGILWMLVESEVVHTPRTYPAAHKMALVVAALTSVMGLVGFVLKQYSNYKNRQLAFMKALGDNLYFRNLDNNAGVFHAVTDAAEEEECKEALLGYFFLLTGVAQNPADLDQSIEAWLRTQGVDVDFEVADALRKLDELGLRKNGAAVELDEACRLLDEQWDNFFQYNQAPVA